MYLKSKHKSKRKFVTWKQILQASIGAFQHFILYSAIAIVNFPWYVDVILIFEHSFHLCQQNDPLPISSAVQMYNVANKPARVGKALEDVFKQYNKASEAEKLDMVLDIIIHNCICKSNIHLNTLFIKISTPNT